MGLIDQLIESLRCLPGIGPKSAQRIAYHLLERDREGAVTLAESLTAAARHVRHCKSCRSFCESELCYICANSKRDHSVLCIVESPADVASIEQSASFSGIYFVLMGHLSPLDGIGPSDLGIDQLEKRFAEHEFSEVILATGTTLEGEATAHYLANLAHEHDIPVSRIAHGIPLGGDLEYVDRNTLSHAITSRRQV